MYYTTRTRYIRKKRFLASATQNHYILNSRFFFWYKVSVRRIMNIATCAICDYDFVAFAL